MSTAVLAMRVLLSLAVVLGLLVVASRAMRNGGLTRGHRAAAPLAVVARQGLTRSGSLVVVRAGERALLLGVTEQHVALLCDMDPSTFDEGTQAPAGTPAPAGGTRSTAWRNAVDALRDRTVRQR